MSINIINNKPNLDDLIIKNSCVIKYKYIHIDSFQNLIFNGIKSSGKTTQIYAKVMDEAKVKAANVIPSF